MHHDLWDWDHVTGPVLFDVTDDQGQTLKGVAAAGKNCLFYMWDRATGEPLHPMIETVVPTETDVPGEQVWPTQPIPHTAAGVPMTPLCATFVGLDDPELAARSGQLYSPYWISKAVIVPHGGSSFGSPAFSPSTGLVYVTGKNGGRLRWSSTRWATPSSRDQIHVDTRTASRVSIASARTSRRGSRCRPMTR